MQASKSFLGLHVARFWVFEVASESTSARKATALVPWANAVFAFSRILKVGPESLPQLDTCSFKNGRDDVNDMMELGTKAANVLDMVWPRDRHPLPCATEVRRYLLHPLERRFERPRPSPYSASALYCPLAL